MNFSTFILKEIVLVKYKGFKLKEAQDNFHLIISALHEAFCKPLNGIIVRHKHIELSGYLQKSPQLV